MDLTINNKKCGIHGKNLKEWIQKQHWMMLSISFCKFVPSKRQIAQIHFMKNGSSNGITANIQRMQKKVIYKMIFVVKQLIVVKDFVVVLPLLLMKMASNLESCMSAAKLTPMNGWTTWIGKHSILLNAWLSLLLLSLLLHLQ